MNREKWCLVWLSLLVLAAGVFNVRPLGAEIQRNRKDEGVVLGKWQPPEADTLPGQFLPKNTLDPGDALAVKVFLESPGEEVSVALQIDATDTHDMHTRQDGGQHDLLPQHPGVLLTKLTSVLDEEATYTVSVDDSSGKPPVERTFHISDGYLKAVGALLGKLRNIPPSIANLILRSERGFEHLPLLVLADAAGNLRDILHVENGALQTPIWLPDDRILVVHITQTGGVLKQAAVTEFEFAGPLEDFGTRPTPGLTPQLTPDREAIVFRQDQALVVADLDGASIVPLIQDKTVVQLLGVVPAAADRYQVVFTAREDSAAQRVWLATVCGQEVLALEELPTRNEWELLSKLQTHHGRVLYEQREPVGQMQRVWNIYLKPAPEADPRKMTPDTFHDRFPAWSLDGAKIVYVSGKAAQR